MSEMNCNSDFWRAIDTLAASGKIVIDRPKGSRHPKYSHIVYELDYGYIDGSTSMDGAGIDVWRGSLADTAVNAIMVIVSRNSMISCYFDTISMILCQIFYKNLD